MSKLDLALIHRIILERDQFAPLWFLDECDRRWIPIARARIFYSKKYLLNIVELASLLSDLENKKNPFLVAVETFGAGSKCGSAEDCLAFVEVLNKLRTI